MCLLTAHVTRSGLTKQDTRQVFQHAIESVDPRSKYFGVIRAKLTSGGYGTRLRPLTLTKPKPLVEFANQPMVRHQIEALAAAGVTDIVLAVNYRPEVMVETLKQYEKEYGVNITFSVETEPLGTAGPLKLAEKVLGKDDSPFFVLNSDVICNYPFKELLAFHEAHGGEGTIVATKVEDPSKYGVIVHHLNSSRIERFVEKPQTFVGNRINAGIYILNPSVIDLIELRPTSIEKETFPALAARGTLHSFDLEGYWMDVGQPKDFLAGTGLYLNACSARAADRLVAKDAEYLHSGHVLVHPTAKIDPSAKLGPNVVIGENVVVGKGARISRSVIMANATVKPHAHVRNSIVGWNCRLGRWSRIENVTVLGDDVEIKDEVYVNGGRVLPHKSISANVEKPEIIM